MSLREKINGQFNQALRNKNKSLISTFRLILAAITLVEFLIFYVESLGVLLIPIMLVLSLMKFVIVVAFFMHLRFDNKLFTYLFFAGFILAAVIAVALLILLAIKP